MSDGAESALALQPAFADISIAKDRSIYSLLGSTLTSGVMGKLSTIQTGIAGEYFVAAELTRRGLVASLTLRNTRGIDILASNVDATKSVGIQVKTKCGNKPDWILNNKAEIDVAENLFYVFVLFEELDTPQYYIVPRATVANFCRESHKAWLAAPGKAGNQHKDTDMRKFQDPKGVYRDRWDLLGLT